MATNEGGVEMQQPVPAATSSPQPGENQPAGTDSVPPHVVAPAAAEQNALIVHGEQPQQQDQLTTSSGADGANGTLGFTPGVEVVSPSAYLDLLRKVRCMRRTRNAMGIEGTRERGWRTGSYVCSPLCS
jgi:hypothetical protein